MSDHRALRSDPVLALFDLDGTLTWRDTLFAFLSGYLARHPARLTRCGRVFPALVRYVRDRDRGALKSAAIRATMGGATRIDVDAYAEWFVQRLKPRRTFRPAALEALEAHRAAGDRLVLLSASPDLYVPRIGRLLGFERTLCTEIRWSGDTLDGALQTQNRHGAEKSRCLEWLRKEYPHHSIIAYGNSASDLDHMRRADQAVLVNANAAARRLAAGARIPVAEWT